MGLQIGRSGREEMARGKRKCCLRKKECEDGLSRGQ